MSGPVLDYKGPSARQERRQSPRGGGAGVGLVLSAACLALPLLGLWAQIGPLFLSGLPLSVLGLSFGLLTLYANRFHDGLAALSAVVSVVNGISLLFFAWLFFVRGIC